MGNLCDKLCGSDPDPQHNPGPKGYVASNAYQPQGGADISNPEIERQEAQRALEAAQKLASEQGSLAHGTTQRVSATGA